LQNLLVLSQLSIKIELSVFQNKEIMRQLFFLLLFAIACKHQPNFCDLPTKSLEEILPGKWQKSELKGWPHSSDTFVPVPDDWPIQIISFSEDGIFYWEGLPPNSTYEVGVRNSENVVFVNGGSYGWPITEFDNCYFVFRFDGNDEGPVWWKYIRVEE
jgi:hypothetical protein